MQCLTNALLAFNVSWINVPENSHFPIQNIPFGVFSTVGTSPRVGTAIGDHVVDLSVLYGEGMFDGVGIENNVFGESTLNSFMAMNSSVWTSTRNRIISLLASDCSADKRLESNEEIRKRAIFPVQDVIMHLPATIGDYTGFYSSREHATNVGIMFRGVENALQPNWLHLPVGYHGRSSSVVISGTDVVRPSGQIHVDPKDATKGPRFSECLQLDFELEMGYFVGGRGNPMGRPMTMAEAEESIFGVVLLNDWSARDIQAWEYVPLGPFTAKNFATSISPWIVTIDALNEFRCSGSAGPEQVNPQPQEYLFDPNYARSAFDVNLEVSLTPEDSQEETVISSSNLKYMYWNMKQQLVHHSITGCPMRAGDLLGSGTISGPDETSYGSMLELSWRGAKDIKLKGDKNRKFLQDGDTVTMTGFAQGNGYRVGFGSVTGKILPAHNFKA